MFSKQELKAAIDIANKLGNHRDLTVMSDILSFWEKKGRITSGQINYATSLIGRNSEERLQEMTDWSMEYKGDGEAQKDAKIIAGYYLTTPYYTKTAKQVLAGEVPTARGLKKMVDNKYAKMVLESTKAAPRWSVGQLVACRSTANGRWHLVSGDGQYWKLSGDGVYTIIQIGSRPIDKALTYKPKQGGSRYYRLLMLGSTRIIDVMECDLKKIPKKLIS